MAKRLKQIDLKVTNKKTGKSLLLKFGPRRKATPPEQYQRGNSRLANNKSSLV